MTFLLVVLCVFVISVAAAIFIGGFLRAGAGPYNNTCDPDFDRKLGEDLDRMSKKIPIFIKKR